LIELNRFRYAPNGSSFSPLIKIDADANSDYSSSMLDFGKLRSLKASTL
jgi:hypothetical protein